MVKKKAAKKAAVKKAPKRAAKKAAKKAPAFNGAKARKGAAKKAAKPRSRTAEQLELIKGVRYADLDRFCRNIGDNRDEVNQHKGEGKSLEQGALKAMRLHGVTAYKASGVLLMVVPGDEKLSVKRDRDGGASDGGQTEPAADEQGEGQEPGAIGEALTEGGGDED
jgi:hypothetical protein